MNLYRRIDAFGFSGSERRRQPERLQTCYENHDAVRIMGAYLKLPAPNKLLSLTHRLGHFSVSSFFPAPC
jgi:hypothetical protein